MFSWYKYLIVGLVFSRLGFWSGNLFLIAPFPDLCLLVPFFQSSASCMYINLMSSSFLILECTESPRGGSGIFPNCSTDLTGITRCFPYCKDGTSMQPSSGKYDTYMCGPNTGYKWTPFTWFPECVSSGRY